MDYILESFDTTDIVVMIVIGIAGLIFLFKYITDSPSSSKMATPMMQSSNNMSTNRSDNSLISRMKSEDRNVSFMIL